MARVLFTMFLCGCGTSAKDSGTVTTGDIDTDADADADADADTDTDTDIDTDTYVEGDTDYSTGDLPEGDKGIASRYPGDAGIGADPYVIFADDFESYGDADDLGDRWDAVYQLETTRIVTDPGEVFAGAQSLQFLLPQQGGERSNTVALELKDELDLLFLRFYSRFEASFDVVGSSHNGAGISAHYFVDGHASPGEPADGFNKFLVEYESWRAEAADSSPGRLNVYVYHPEQRSKWGDHFFPTGAVLPFSYKPFDFGPKFVSRPDVVPELDRWHAYELMVLANTPGARDGRIGCWLDGALIADFRQLRLRDIDTLTIDRFSLSLHAGSNGGPPTGKLYDNVVAATRYIGPMVE